ncbi:MAG: DNA-directed RNA polymerase specialized sigma24 family protein [Pseudohongiellaceae bacterium]|jgi:DNA-directed RNA polymerase specialized sigma24 family protein
MAHHSTDSRPHPQFLKDAAAFARDQLGPRMEELLSNDSVLLEVKASADASADLEDGVLSWIHKNMPSDPELENEFVGYFWGQLYQRGRTTMASKSPLRRLLDTADLANTVYRRIGPRLSQFEYRSRRQFMRLLLLNMENRAKDKIRQFNAVKRGEQKRASESIEDVANNVLSPEEQSDPIMAAIRSEQGRMVFLICSQLNDMDRALIKGMLESESPQDMAAKMGKSAAAVRLALKRALGKVRDLSEHIT